MEEEDAALEIIRAANPSLKWLAHLLVMVYDAVGQASEEGVLTPEEESCLHEGLDRLDLEVTGIVERLAVEAGLLPVRRK